MVLLATGVVAAVVAKNNYDAADKRCPEHEYCSDAVLSKRDTAEVWANVANVGFATGGATLAIGVPLAFMLEGNSESSEPHQVEARLLLTDTGVMTSLGGRF